MTYAEKPEPFFHVLVHDISSLPSVSGLSVGYEQNEWRYDGLIESMLEWLPEFALNYSEYVQHKPSNSVRKLREAARRIYQSDKYKSRGEFGELILHALIREIFNSEPAVSKIFYKDSSNDTVKGFDSVHVVATDKGDLELWLGEVKFYEKISKAIADVCAELEKHNNVNFLKDEFILIGNKLDPKYKYFDQIKKLLSPNTSLDDIFKSVKIPVLLTYNSETIPKFNAHSSKEYTEAFEQEIAAHYATFCKKSLPANLIIHLFLIPLHTKAELQKRFDAQLKGLQMKKKA